MSSRNFRKVVGNSSLPPPEDDSDGEYQPFYSQGPAQSKYAGLQLSSQSESEHGTSERSEEEQDAAAALPSSFTSKKKNYKKKGKGKGVRHNDNLDEVERSVQEVNAILGTPPPAPSPTPAKPNWALELLRIDSKNLNVTNELRRLFGPEETDQNRRARVQNNRALLLKRVSVHPNKDTAVYDFRTSGMSMAKYKDVKERKYFVYNHDEQYQKMHRAFLAKYNNAQGTAILMHLDEARKNMHVEALLEISDLLFRMEENGLANEIVENVVMFLQYVAHPQFLLTDTGTRLDYKFVENRPFHVAMLKYVYLLSNKACHRTALEIAKVLLIVDPNDPLAMLSLIDILALRAREHEWLIEAVAYFDKQREATLLYNIKFSLALAHFHVATKKKEDLTQADKLLHDAILAHPQVLVKILDCANASNLNVRNHVIFKKDPPRIGTPGLEELFMIYAKMTWPRWREPAVMGWLLKNVDQLCVNFDTMRKVRSEAKNYYRMRVDLFQIWPPEYLRHISVLSSMAKLILDAPLTAFHRPTCGWDPLFDEGINRYEYRYSSAPPRNVGVSRNAVYSYDTRNDLMIALNQMTIYPMNNSFFDRQAYPIGLKPAPGQSTVDKTNPLCYENYGDYSNYDYDDDYDNFREDDEEMEYLARDNNPEGPESDDDDED